MKRLLVIALVLVACTNQNVAGPSPSPTSPAQSQAADLRTRMDLLMSEQVMIIAKESAAAVNHSDEYAGYTSLLAINSSDLTNLMTPAFGNTAGVQFAQAWNVQNGFLVAYAIAIVTHNNERSQAAMNGLTATFTPQFTQLITTMTHLPSDPTTQVISAQVAEDKAFIDDIAAGSFVAYYADLQRAYAHSALLGDLLSEQIALDFPDKFPGDPTISSVDRRVALNLALQELSYLETLDTDANVNHRAAETSAAIQEVFHDTDSLNTVVEDSRFALTWRLEAISLVDYAIDNPTVVTRLTQDIPTELAALTKASREVIVSHEKASIKVVDDQRSNSPSIADDDRAAATSMQPIADSI